MSNVNWDPEDEDDDIPIDYPWDDEEEDLRKMKDKHPGHSEDSYRTGRNLGVDFPYVPGDPFW